MHVFLQDKVRKRGPPKEDGGTHISRRQFESVVPNPVDYSTTYVRTTRCLFSPHGISALVSIWGQVTAQMIKSLEGETAML